MLFWDILTKASYQVKIIFLSDGTKNFVGISGYDLTIFELNKAYSLSYGKAYCSIKTLPRNSESYVYLKT